MRNWSGSVQWQPTQVAKPDSEQAIQSIVQKAAENKQNIRLIGTGHSFTRLCETNEILMSLDNYQGLISVDKEKMLARVKGGTKLHYLGDLLYAEGLAMENLGDIDVQSIAGTISTGTHGTGTAFGTISTQVKALKFVDVYKRQGKGCCPQGMEPFFLPGKGIQAGVVIPKSKHICTTEKAKSST